MCGKPRKQRYQARYLVGSVMLLIVLCSFSNLYAQPQVFRIGTGGSAGTYFPIGSLIANAFTDRATIQPATRYEIPQLLALAQRSNGSVANIREISEGLLEAGLVQADVAHWAFHGDGPFTSSKPLKNLRTVATLYLESLHLVVRNGSGIDGVSDLPGHRVSLDEVGSGTLLDVRPVLDAYGISVSELKPVYLKPTDAIDRLRREKLDAFFIVAGYPVTAVTELVNEGKARVIAIDGNSVTALLKEYPFFTFDSIPANTYNNSQAIQDIGSGSSTDNSCRFAHRVRLPDHPECCGVTVLCQHLPTGILKVRKSV